MCSLNWLQIQTRGNLFFDCAYMKDELNLIIKINCSKIQYNDNVHNEKTLPNLLKEFIFLDSP